MNRDEIAWGLGQSVVAEEIEGPGKVEQLRSQFLASFRTLVPWAPKSLPAESPGSFVPDGSAWEWDSKTRAVKALRGVKDLVVFAHGPYRPWRVAPDSVDENPWCQADLVALDEQDPSKIWIIDHRRRGVTMLEPGNQLVLSAEQRAALRSDVDKVRWVVTETEAQRYRTMAGIPSRPIGLKETRRLREEVEYFLRDRLEWFPDYELTQEELDWNPLFPHLMPHPSHDACVSFYERWEDHVAAFLRVSEEWILMHESRRVSAQLVSPDGIDLMALRRDSVYLIDHPRRDWLVSLPMIEPHHGGSGVATLPLNP